MADKRVQRRLAAILAADVAGYSRMVAADEARTLSRLRALRDELLAPTIAEYQGRIVKEMGDGLLVEFGSAVDAVECTVAIQRALAAHESGVPEESRIRYRAGINLGDIVIDGDDILGDGVNLAARLEGLAEPGGMIISAAVYGQIHNKLDLSYEDIGKRSVKNIKEPVHVYRVLPTGRPEITDMQSEEGDYRQRVRSRYEEDAAFYVPLTGKTADVVSPEPAKALRSAGRRRRRAMSEYHEWIPVGEDIKQVKLESLGDAVEKYPSLLLLGEPGCGKTTAIEALAYDYAGRCDRLPLLVRLNELTAGTAVEDLIARSWGGSEEVGHWRAPELAGNLRRFLETGKLLVLLDCPSSEILGRCRA